MGNKIEVSIVQGLYVTIIFKDVPNLLNGVPNFVKDEPNFVKNVPRVPKFILKWRMTFNHYLRVLKG